MITHVLNTIFLGTKMIAWIGNGQIQARQTTRKRHENKLYLTNKPIGGFLNY